MFPNANAFLTGGRLVEEWYIPWYQIDCNQEKKWQNYEKYFDKCFSKGCHYEQKEAAASILAGGGLVVCNAPLHTKPPPPPPPPSENNNHCLHTFVLQSLVIRTGLYGFILAVSTRRSLKCQYHTLYHVQGFDFYLYALYLFLSRGWLGWEAICVVCRTKCVNSVSVLQSSVSKCKEI